MNLASAVRAGYHADKNEFKKFLNALDPDRGHRGHRAHDRPDVPTIDEIDVLTGRRK